MHAIIRIDMDNAAFDNPFELNYVLSKLAGRIHGMQVKPGDVVKCRDTNGNTVGELRIEEE